MHTIEINGIAVPRFFYGTAWKEDKTKNLVELAIQSGFRAIDTANQRKHYHEAGVGEAIAASIERGLVTRDDLFLQTKYTFVGGQDHRLPYHPNDPIQDQVQQSFAKSLEHLGVTAIDSYVLHGPSQRFGLGKEDWAAWRAMEEIQKSGRTRMLGVSNVDYEQLDELCQKAEVRPTFVQNRCYAIQGWDREVREFCKAHHIHYQGFSLLTANTKIFGKPEMTRIAKRYQRTVCQIIFRFALDVGMVPLTGTTSGAHMKEDLGALDFQLERADLQMIENLMTE